MARRGDGRTAPRARHLRRQRSLPRPWLPDRRAGAEPVRRAADRDPVPRRGQRRTGARAELRLALSPRAQNAFEPILSFEEFTAGNYTIGRGYDPAIIAGDSGVGVAAELRGPRINAGQVNRIAVQPYLFGDAAWVWNHNDGGGSEHLQSAGGGVRADLGSRLQLDAALAVPLERAGLQTKRGDPRLLVTLTSRFIPWR